MNDNKPPVPSKVVPAVGHAPATLEGVLRELRDSRREQREALAELRRETSDRDAETKNLVLSLGQRVVTVEGALAESRTSTDAKVTALTAMQVEQTKMITAIKDAVVGVVTNKKLRFLAGIIIAILTAMTLSYARKHGVEVLP